jgi:hypothetical protein
MVRRPRIEFVDAFYHVLSRGNHREAISQDGGNEDIAHGKLKRQGGVIAFLLNFLFELFKVMV